MAHPSQSKHKRLLATLALQSGEIGAAHAVLASLSAEEDLARSRESASLQALVESHVGGGEDEQGRGLKLAQRAVMLSPWKDFDWKVLAHVRTASGS